MAASRITSPKSTHLSPCNYSCTASKIIKIQIITVIVWCSHTPTNKTVLLHYLTGINDCTVTKITPMQLCEATTITIQRILHEWEVWATPYMILRCWHSWKFTVPSLNPFLFSLHKSHFSHAFSARPLLPPPKKFKYMCFSHAPSHERSSMSLCHAGKVWTEEREEASHGLLGSLPASG
jgi:hypothetical protein